MGGGPGIDDHPFLLSYFQLLLGYLPPTVADWPAVLASKRASYAQFCADFARDGPPAARPDDGDHPLSSDPSSSWATHFADAELLAQIERDVMRTHPSLDCFGGAGARGREARAALRRALLVFAKTNAGIGYVQGMNELLAPLYHACASDPESQDGDGATDPSSPPAAEADAFWCLVALMADFMDNFIAALDDSSTGVKRALADLAADIRSADPALAHHLFDLNRVDPAFFGFRWTTTLLTQEFALPDLVRVWDGLLAHPGPARPAALRRLCVAMVLAARSQLLAGDFVGNVKLLQAYPGEVGVGEVLRSAAALERE